MKKQYIPFSQVRTAVEDSTGGGCIYAVNKTQYEELIRLEGQSMIRDNSVHFISGIAQILQVKKRIKKNYIITSE